WSGHVSPRYYDLLDTKFTRMNVGLSLAHFVQKLKRLLRRNLEAGGDILYRWQPPHLFLLPMPLSPQVDDGLRLDLRHPLRLVWFALLKPQLVHMFSALRFLYWLRLRMFHKQTESHPRSLQVPRGLVERLDRG